MNITVTIDDEKIRNLLCCAFEGGSNDWYFIEDVKYPEGFTADDYGDGGKAQPNSYWNWSQIVPMQEGGKLIIRSQERDEVNGSKEWVLDRPAIERGLKVMAEKYGRHFGDVIGGSEDGITGDVFLQCCLFGELVFG